MENENGDRYKERCDQRWKYAEEQLEIIIHNDELWDLFKQQLSCRREENGRILESADEFREKLLNRKITEQFRVEKCLLQSAYVHNLIFVCDDFCEYNLRRRKGVRKYTFPRNFYCVFKKEGAKPNEPPLCLDLERKICSNYYKHF